MLKTFIFSSLERSDRMRCFLISRVIHVFHHPSTLWELSQGQKLCSFLACWFASDSYRGQTMCMWRLNAWWVFACARSHTLPASWGSCCTTVAAMRFAAGHAGCKMLLLWTHSKSGAERSTSGWGDHFLTGSFEDAHRIQSEMHTTELPPEDRSRPCWFSSLSILVSN